MSAKAKRRGRAAAAQGEPAAVEVDDPARAGKTSTVLRQLRGDPLAKLHAHAQIDDAQYRAGRAFQRDWETAARAPGGNDPTRARVDGGLPPQPRTEQQVRARKRLDALEPVLGRTMQRVLQAVLIDGMSMETLAERLFDRQGEASARYYGRLFRDALDLLAVEYHFASR